MAAKLRIPDKHMLLCPMWAPPDPRGTFIALALAGEAGELSNLFKKEWRDGVDIERRHKMIDELGDIMVYVRALAQHMNIDVVAESEKKLKAFRKRPGFERLLEEAKRRTNEALMGNVKKGYKKKQYNKKKKRTKNYSMHDGHLVAAMYNDSFGAQQ